MEAGLAWWSELSYAEGGGSKAPSSWQRNPRSVLVEFESEHDNLRFSFDRFLFESLERETFTLSFLLHVYRREFLLHKLYFFPELKMSSWSEQISLNVYKLLP